MKLRISLMLILCLSILSFEAFDAVGASESEGSYPKASQRKYRSRPNRYDDSSASYPKAKKHNGPALKTNLSKDVKYTPVESVYHSNYGAADSVFRKEHEKIENAFGRQSVFSDDHVKVNNKLSVKPTDHNSISRTKTTLNKEEKIGITDRGSLDNVNTSNNREVNRKLELESYKVKSRMSGGSNALAEEHLKVKEKLTVKDSRFRRNKSSRRYR